MMYSCCNIQFIKSYMCK